LVVWIRGNGQTYVAETAVDPLHKVHLQVEDLGNSGWEWHVWDTGARLPARYGISNNADQAKSQAEAAYGMILVQLSWKRPD